MALIVQKYGGTSVGDADKIKNVARRIAARQEKGDELVVVVSAMGHTTDDLIALAHQINPHPEDRELDVLLSTGETVSSTLMAMALHEMGLPAISLSGLKPASAPRAASAAPASSRWTPSASTRS